MTTVAWDGRSIAADRMYAIGNTPVRAPVPKIRRLTYRGVPAVMGTSGVTEYGLALMDWLESGAPAGKEPELGEGDDGCTVLVATAAGVWLFANSCTGVMIGTLPWATGSGADYALGAMAMGASAKKAVEVACKLDVNSGCGTDMLRLRGL
jgi:ATP-dependent protease HslVU (ClpYQ) peptidase subunit